MKPFSLPKTYTYDGNPNNIVYDGEFYENYGKKLDEEACNDLKKIYIENMLKF